VVKQSGDNITINTREVVAGSDLMHHYVPEVRVMRLLSLLDLIMCPGNNLGRLVEKTAE
jgi:ABC-type Zn uptake system ZnuABC Zn-binding protein ZnuA